MDLAAGWRRSARLSFGPQIPDSPAPGVLLRLSGPTICWLSRLQADRMAHDRSPTRAARTRVWHERRCNSSIAHPCKVRNGGRFLSSSASRSPLRNESVSAVVVSAVLTRKGFRIGGHRRSSPVFHPKKEEQLRDLTGARVWTLACVGPGLRRARRATSVTTSPWICFGATCGRKTGGRYSPGGGGAFDRNPGELGTFD
jgi:hypothetical protein